MTAVVEVRCPVGPRRLFTKLRLANQPIRVVQPGNLIEFPCSDCARSIRRREGRDARVLHRYDFAGELVETLTVERDEGA